MSHLKSFTIIMIMLVLNTVTIFANTEPTKTEKLTEDGKNIIVEIYEVETSATSNNFIKEQFYDNDVKYVFSNIEEIENVYVEEKEVTVPKESVVKSGNKDEIIANLEKEIPYEDEYGYIGNVQLDEESLIITENEKSTKSWYKTESKSYDNFMYKDNSVIPSSITNSNGVKLSLQSVSWEATQRELNGVGELVDTKYKAVANYGATVYSTTIDNYKVEFLYKGVVAKNMTEGKRIEVRYVSVPEEVVAEKNDSNVFFTKDVAIVILKLAGLIAVLAGIVLLILYLIKYIKSLKGVEIYNFFDDGKGLHYVYLGKASIDVKVPILDLNLFSEEIQSSNFSFVVDKNTTNQLFGKCMAITLDGVTVMHEIDDKGVEHTFKLTIGESDDLLSLRKATVVVREDSEVVENEI